MSRAWELSIEERVTELRGEVEKVKGVLEDLDHRLVNLDQALDALGTRVGAIADLASTLAVDAPEKVNPIKVPPKPKILRTMFPDEPPKGDAAA